MQRKKLSFPDWLDSYLTFIETPYEQRMTFSTDPKDLNGIYPPLNPDVHKELIERFILEHRNTEPYQPLTKHEQVRTTLEKSLFKHAKWRWLKYKFARWRNAA